MFGWLLPQFIDYNEVWDALTELDTNELVVLLGLVRVPTEALMYRTFLPGLRLWLGSEAHLSSNFAGQILPPPGASLAVARDHRVQHRHERSRSQSASESADCFGPGRPDGIRAARGGSG